MAYVHPSGTVKVRPFSRPLPKYDFEPMFANQPDEVGLRKQAAILIARAIRMADSEGFGLEDGDSIGDEWKIDWGQRIASGTYRREVERLLADVPAERIEKVLLRAFYRSVMEMIEVGDDSLTCLMGIHAMDGLVTNSTAEYDSLQLSFSKGDEIPLADGDEGGNPDDADDEEDEGKHGQGE